MKTLLTTTSKAKGSVSKRCRYPVAALANIALILGIFVASVIMMPGSSPVALANTPPNSLALDPANGTASRPSRDSGVSSIGRAKVQQGAYEDPARPETRAGDGALTVPGCWNVVPSPDVGVYPNLLSGVAVVTSADVWAVGNKAAQQTLVEHWDGSTWNIVPSPNVGSSSNFLMDVEAVSSNDIWAVGYYQNGGVSGTLVERWDGSAWTVVPSPNQGSSNSLYDVAVAGANDVWAVGYYSNGTVFQTLVEHWNGSTWSVVPSPNVGPGDNQLWGVEVVSPNDVWAVGYWSGGGTSQTLTEHWDGSAWIVVPSPNAGSYNRLYGVATAGAGDVWAVGSYLNGSTVQTLTEHWDGTTWNIVPSPNQGSRENVLSGVEVVSPNDVWAVGEYYLDGVTRRTLVEHWDGTTWNIIPSPNPGSSNNGLTSIAVASINDIWAVGYKHSGTTFQSLIERYTDFCPTPTPTSIPSPPTRTPTATYTSTVTPSSTSTSPPTPTSCALTFTDVPSTNTFYLFVRCLACRGILSGYPCGGEGEPCDQNNNPYFRPNVNVTRGQIAKIVSNAAGYNEDPDPQLYEDVDSTNPFYQWINRLSRRGHMGGYPCGTVPEEPCNVPDSRPYFRPFNLATRGQLAKIVSNAAGFSDPPGDQIFADVLPENRFYVWIQRLASRGIMGGYPCGGEGEPCDDQQRPYFRPFNNVTRGQTSKIVAGAFFPNCQNSNPQNR